MDPLRIWFDRPLMRWRRVVVTVLIASALVGLWVAQRRGLFDEPRVRAVLAVGAAATAPAPRRVEGEPVAEPAPIVAAVAPAKAASSVEIICGLGAVSFDPGDEAQFEALTKEANQKLQAHRDRVMPGWLEEMKSSADEQVQAVAWFLEAQRTWLKRAEGPPKAEALDSLDELARLAERSRDPLPYALAFQSCEMYRDRAVAPACDALRVEGWAQRDPGNAYPWLVAAGKSGLDAQRRSLYIERALAADLIRSTWGATYPVLARAALGADSPLDRTVRVVEAISIDSYVSAAQGIVIGHCSDNELRQGMRRPQCERLATFLTEKADTFLPAVLGASMGRRLGWSEDRLAALKREQEALQEAAPKDEQITGCDGLVRVERFLSDAAKYGELGALRRRQQAAR